LVQNELGAHRINPRARNVSLDDDLRDLFEQYGEQCREGIGARIESRRRTSNSLGRAYARLIDASDPAFEPGIERNRFKEFWRV
jgi:hypothetical protein